MNAFSKVCIVKGAAFFNDKIDGELIDSGTVFIEESLDESTGRAKGFRTVDYRCPDHQIAKALIARQLPEELEVQFEIATSKSRQVIRVAGFRAVTAKPNPSPMPKAA